MHIRDRLLFEAAALGVVVVCSCAAVLFVRRIDRVLQAFTSRVAPKKAA